MPSSRWSSRDSARRIETTRRRRCSRREDAESADVIDLEHAGRGHDAAPQSARAPERARSCRGQGAECGNRRRGSRRRLPMHRHTRGRRHVLFRPRSGRCPKRCAAGRDPGLRRGLDGHPASAARPLQAVRGGGRGPCRRRRLHACHGLRFRRRRARSQVRCAGDARRFPGRGQHRHPVAPGGAAHRARIPAVRRHVSRPSISIRTGS